MGWIEWAADIQTGPAIVVQQLILKPSHTPTRRRIPVGHVQLHAFFDTGKAITSILGMPFGMNPKDTVQAMHLISL
jgi:hypothetical protein